MNIRSLEELGEKLDADFSWRRRELSTIALNIKSSKGPYLQTSIRGGITLLYAHWEGFIKNAADYYLNYVSCKKLPYNQLNYCFIALALRQNLNALKESNKTSTHIQIIDFLMNDLTQTSRIPVKDIINTNSNLSSDVLKEIIDKLGLDYSEYELKKNAIDKRLLYSRNNIAHGQYLEMKVTDFIDLYDEITDMMTLFKNQIINAASLKEYCK